MEKLKMVYDWHRFLRHTVVFTEEVNLVASKGSTGEPVFDLIKDLGPKTELVAFFLPERPGNDTKSHQKMLRSLCE